MTTEELNVEKSKYLVATNGGIALPAVGFIYWLLLGMAGFYLDYNFWFKERSEKSCSQHKRHENEIFACYSDVGGLCERPY